MGPISLCSCSRSELAYSLMSRSLAVTIWRLSPPPPEMSRLSSPNFVGFERAVGRAFISMTRATAAMPYYEKLLKWMYVFVSTGYEACGTWLRALHSCEHSLMTWSI